MDYDAMTGEVYVPDQLHQQLEVLTPLSSGTTRLPTEPNRIIRLQAAPQSVAITSDGQLGFVALAGGTVAMLDLPGRQIVTTLAVSGNPHFIITGLYPPLLGTTPEQAPFADVVNNILSYWPILGLLAIGLGSIYFQY
jgi:hypothetical protein